MSDNELLMPADKLLIRAGIALGVLSLKTGHLDPTLQKMAQSHAVFQAKRNKLGHQQWDARARELFKALPKYTNFREVAAMAKAGQDEEAVGLEIFKVWQASPPHWRSVNGPCAIWGYAMALNPTAGIWYACGIFADEREDQYS